MARTAESDRDRPYTLRQALKEAHEILRDEFGTDVDQHAAVSLASALYGAHERDMFLRESGAESSMPYGGPASGR